MTGICLGRGITRGTGHLIHKVGSDSTTPKTWWQEIRTWKGKQPGMLEILPLGLRYVHRLPTVTYFWFCGGLIFQIFNKVCLLSGLDRLLSIICGATSIRDVIAFPKSGDGKDLMADAPAAVSVDDLLYYKLLKQWHICIHPLQWQTFVFTH